MNSVKAKEGFIINLGTNGENLATQIQFDYVQCFREKYGNGVFQLSHQRKGDTAPYAVDVETNETSVLWNVRAEDVAKVGVGECQLSYFVNNVIAKTIIFSTKVERSLGQNGESPDPWESYHDDIMRAGAEAKASAQEIEDLTVSAHRISLDSEPTVTKTKPEGQPYNLDFGIPLVQDTDDLESQIAQIERNLFTLKESIGYPHTFIQATGALKTRADYNFIVTKLLPVSAGQTIAYKIYHTQVLPIVALYNSTTISAASYIGNVTGIRGWSEGTYTVPNDGYIAFSMSTAYLDESYIKFTDNIPDNIEAYVKSAISASSFLPQKILCFGDSILGNDGQTVEHLAEYTGSQVLNAAVGGTSVSPRTSTGNIYFPLDGENLITAFTTGDWSTQNAVKSQHTQQVRERIDMLQALDTSTIDLIILAWGTNDYTQGKTIEQITASLGHCIDMLQETYPLCRILVLCNTWRFFSLTSDSDNMVYNVSTGKEIANAIEAFCTNRRISVMNGYKLMETSLKNATTYFDNVTTGGDADQQSGIEVPSGSGQYYSGVHYNDAGNKMYAHLINGKIRSMY